MLPARSVRLEVGKDSSVSFYFTHDHGIVFKPGELMGRDIVVSKGLFTFTQTMPQTAMLTGVAFAALDARGIEIPVIELA